MGVIKFNINSKIFYEDYEYSIKSYPSADKVLLKQSISPYKEIIVKVNDLIKDSKNANEPEKSQVEYGDKALDKANEKYEIIKPLLEMDNRTAKDVEKRAKKFNAAKIRSDEIGVDFKFLTELNFNDIYISNIDFLYRFILHPSEDKYDDIILDNLKDKKISALELANLIMKSPIEYQRISNNIWKLVAQNILKTDLENEKVTMKSILEINNGSN